jgi:exopolysaccharide biosynthesis WecB/TagA/CpsF family protein
MAAAPVDRGRHDVIGVRIDAMNYRAVVDRVIAAAAERRPLAVSLSAVHSVTIGAIDPVHRWRLNHLDMVIPDGQPVRWALNRLHRTALSDRVYGPKLMCLLCREAALRGLPVYLFGSTPTVLGNLERNLVKRFPGLIVAGREPSQFRSLSPAEAEGAVARIRDAGPAIVFVGLGCPLQEIWAYENRNALGVPLIAAGAAFDYLAGHLPQPPEWIQRRGLEWLFRLVQEPCRLWRRYMLLNPVYLLLVALQWSRVIRLDPDAAVEPRLPTNVG